MLRGIRRLSFFSTLILIGGSILLLILQNPQRSQFSLGWWVTPELPFSVFLVVAFVLGGISVAILGIGAAMLRFSPKRNRKRQHGKNID
jgi:uncharacterized integral membrane protein